MEESSIQPAPDFGGDIDARFVSGLATIDERLLILLDVDRLIDDSVEIDVDATDAQISAVES